MNNIIKTLLLFPVTLLLCIAVYLGLTYNTALQISVVMPVYNTENYLRQSIESILSQSLKDFELIIVNDASTDKSLEIINEYAAKDKRIKVFSLPQNSGAAAARNEGIRHIRGKYTLFVDSDDWMSQNMLRTLYQHAINNNLDIVLSDGLIFNETTQDYVQQDKSPFLEADFLKYHGLKTFSYKNSPYDFFQITTKYPWNKLIRTALIKKYKLQFTPQKKHNDSVFITKALLRAKRIGYVPQGLYVYRINRAGAISSQSQEDWQSVYEVFYTIKEDIKSLGLYNLLQKSFNKWVFSFLPPEETSDEDKTIIENIINLMDS